MSKEQSQNRWFAEKRAEWQSCLDVSVKLSLHSLKVSVVQDKIAIQPKKEEVLHKPQMRESTMRRENHRLPCLKIERWQEALTPEQQASVSQFAREQIAAQLSCKTIDEQEAEAHLRIVYHLVGWEPPTIHWFDSPVAFVLAHFPDNVWDCPPVMEASVKARARMQNRMRKRVRKSIEASVEQRVQDQIWIHVGASVEQRVQDSVWTNIWDQTWDGVRVREEDSIWDPEWDGIRNSVQANIRASVRAYYDQSWHSIFRFFHEVFEPNDLISLACLNELLSGYHFGCQEAWMVRKPVRLERDEAGNLHSADGLCVQYRDGWGFYAWHGVCCSEQVILHPEQLSNEDWLNEPNMAIRRVIQERMPGFMEQMDG